MSIRQATSRRSSRPESARRETRLIPVGATAIATLYRYSGSRDYRRSHAKDHEAGTAVEAAHGPPRRVRMSHLRSERITRDQLVNRAGGFDFQFGNTNGVWLHQASSANFPAGVFYAVHDDMAVAAFDWHEIARTLQLRERCGAK